MTWRVQVRRFRNTLLRLIHRRGTVPSPPPRMVGIDDWAWRRGWSYATIVCDLERRRVIALLPGRSSAPVRDWLAAHPSVTVVSRDRLGPFAEAARTGAPTATQVADRRHLLVSASGALRGVVKRHIGRPRRWNCKYVECGWATPADAEGDKPTKANSKPFAKAEPRSNPLKTIARECRPILPYGRTGNAHVWREKPDDHENKPLGVIVIQEEAIVPLCKSQE